MYLTRLISLFLVGVASIGFASTSPAVSFDWVEVGDEGNGDDWTGWGGVSHAFEISKYEVTNAQYAEFLSAVGATDPAGLYNANMGTHATCGGIERSGSDGSYVYSVKPGFADKPVLFVSFYDAIRFVNWLHNGQPVAAQGPSTTEDGAYTITQQGILDNSIRRNPGVSVFLPSRDEWYKAAYYDPSAHVYYTYPIGPGVAECVVPALDSGVSANCDNVVGAIGEPTDVGSYATSPSPYGTFDQGGNADEWTDTIQPGSAWFQRHVRGGGWDSPRSHLVANQNFGTLPSAELYDVGFRVVVSLPEASHATLVFAALSVLGCLRRLGGRTRVAIAA